MGFGIANILNKYTTPALISWYDLILPDGYWLDSGSITVDVKVSETHKFSNDVTTQTMEDGSVIDEHVINNPMEITLQFEETNNTPLANGLLRNAGEPSSIGKFGFGPISTFEKLQILAQKKVPVTITTYHAIYEDMVFKNMPILHRAPYRGAMQVSCDLVQLNFSKTKTFTYNAKDTGTSKSASANVMGGQQQTTTL